VDYTSTAGRRYNLCEQRFLCLHHQREARGRTRNSGNLWAFIPQKSIMPFCPLLDIGHLWCLPLVLAVKFWSAKPWSWQNWNQGCVDDLVPLLPLALASSACPSAVVFGCHSWVVDGEKFHLLYQNFSTLSDPRSWVKKWLKVSHVHVAALD
jgi:hypothetical protein